LTSRLPQSFDSKLQQTMIRNLIRSLRSLR